MKANKQRVLEQCIEDGIQDALACRKQEYDDEQLAAHIEEYIWISIDYFFNFEED